MDPPNDTLTLVFTDIEDSAAFSEKFLAAFEPTREAHFRLLRAGLERWRGREVKSAGDSLFVVFENAGDAVQWAVEAQRALTTFSWPAPVGPIRVRMGMYTGEPYPSPDANRPDYFGPPVNRAARVMGAAHGGQLLLSETTRAFVDSRLPPDIGLRDLGHHRLKGVGDERLWQTLHPDLPATFPPLNALNPERHNLPAPPTPFLGREAEIALWYGLLTGYSLTPDDAPPVQTTRLLTLTAFGGMGKTRAALHLAELCVERFAHGVCWMEAEGARGRDDLLLRLAQALRLDVSAERALEAQVFAHLRERELLLAVDNAEGIADVAPLVRDLLQAAPLVRVLVTSRRALDIRGETVVELRPLPDADAQRLFVERARAVRDDFALTEENAADIAALCRRLEGVPLALELAAARIAGMTPHQMLPRLNERFRLLQSRSPDLPPRQRALRAAIDWSYDLLQDEERRVFAQLGVFAGGFTLDDAEAVCEGFDVFESVLELRHNSFFRVETDPLVQQDRFVMLDSLREYALERLQGQPDAASVCQRHATHFLDFARAQTARFRGPFEPAALRALAVNEDNLRAALERTTEAGDTAASAELGLQIGRMLERRGYRAQAVAPVQEALDRLTAGRDTHAALFLEALIERAGLALEVGDAGNAARMADEARARAEAARDARGAGEAQNLLGWAAMDARDFASARAHFQAARDQAHRAADAGLQGIALNNLGLTERRDPDGDRALAESHLQSALALRRASGDRRGQAETLNNLGVLAFYRHDWDEAWRLYAEALALERELDHLYGIARQLSNLGEVAAEQTQAARACRLFAASERLMREIGSPLAGSVTAYLTEAAARADLSIDICRCEVEARSVADVAAWAMQAGEKS